MTLEERFLQFEDEALKFLRVQEKRSERRDLHAFLLLNEGFRYFRHRACVSGPSGELEGQVPAGGIDSPGNYWKGIKMNLIARAAKKIWSFIRRTLRIKDWKRVTNAIMTKDNLDMLKRRFGQRGVDTCIGIHNVSISACPSCGRSGCILTAAHHKKNITWFRCEVCSHKWTKDWDL